MAVPRDPNFWKRFSYAVHQDEEAQLNQKSETWLCAIQKQKATSLALQIAHHVQADFEINDATPPKALDQPRDQMSTSASMRHNNMRVGKRVSEHTH
ncbi:hypothetical protein KCU78_g2982, partial [Aureobasidium melanogenum]